LIIEVLFSASKFVFSIILVRSFSKAAGASDATVDLLEYDYGSLPYPEEGQKEVYTVTK
jgi:hypothetical protein